MTVTIYLNTLLSLPFYLLLSSTYQAKLSIFAFFSCFTHVLMPFLLFFLFSFSFSFFCFFLFPSDFSSRLLTQQITFPQFNVCLSHCAAEEVSHCFSTSQPSSFTYSQLQWSVFPYPNSVNATSVQWTNHLHFSTWDKKWVFIIFKNVCCIQPKLPHVI